jgi:hypothetical protein
MFPGKFFFVVAPTAPVGHHAAGNRGSVFENLMENKPAAALGAPAKERRAYWRFENA